MSWFKLHIFESKLLIKLNIVSVIFIYTCIPDKDKNIKRFLKGTAKLVQFLAKL